MMKRGGGVDGSSKGAGGLVGKKSLNVSLGGAGVKGSVGTIGGSSRKLKNIPAFSSPYGLM